MRAILILLTMLWLALPAFAVNPDEMLSDPALEARARTIRKAFAASSARTSRSTIPTPTLRTKSACWCASD